jgi:hypothetical protein
MGSLVLLFRRSNGFPILSLILPIFALLCDCLLVSTANSLPSVNGAFEKAHRFDWFRSPPPIAWQSKGQMIVRFIPFSSTRIARNSLERFEGRRWNGQCDVMKK